MLTVSSSIADLYNKEYGINVRLLRNLPTLKKEVVEVENIKNDEKKILIYQGAINVNRGIEFMIEAMKYLEDTQLYIFGKGDIFKEIEKLIIDLNLHHKVKLMGEIPLKKLYGYTLQADLGLSLEEDIGLNYRFALPNKLFDYIQAGIPVLVSNLPEMKSLVNQYQIGENIDKHEAKHIAEKIKYMLGNEDKMNFWRENAKKAATILNWENEKHVIIEVLND